MPELKTWLSTDNNRTCRIAYNNNTVYIQLSNGDTTLDRNSEADNIESIVLSTIMEWDSDDDFPF